MKETVSIELLNTDSEIKREYIKRSKERIYTSINKSEYQDNTNWKIEKEYKHIYRISKEKEVIESLIDKVWSLFIKFGIKQITIEKTPIKIIETEGIEQFDINIITIDDEFVFVIKCFAIEKLGKSPELLSVIEEFSKNKNYINNIIKRQFGRNKKPIYIIATENILWDDKANEKLKEAKLLKFDEYDILKLQELTALAGEGAKYQVYNRVLQGSRIKSLSLKVPSIKSKMGGIKYYTFSLSPEELLKIAYVHQRATDCTFTDLSDSYQRMLKKSRIKKIKEYISKGGFFPGAIILNFNKKIKEIGILGKKIDRDIPKCNSSPVIIELPPYYGSAWIIDGQHRLYGYADLSLKKTETLPVVAFENLERSKQAKIFLDINENQTSISSDLKWDLYEDLYSSPSNEKERQLFIISRIVKKLNEKEPFKSEIKIPKDELTNQYAKIRLESVCKAIQRSKFVNKPGDVFYNESINTTIDNTFYFIKLFFRIIAQNLQKQWEKGDKHFIKTSNGFVILIAIFKDLLPSLSEYIIEKNKFESKLKQFLLPLTNYINSFDDEKIKYFKNASIARAQTPEAIKELIKEIIKGKEYHSDFLDKLKPVELHNEFVKYLNKDESTTFEVKGSMSLNVNRYLIDKAKEIKNEFAKEGILKTIVGFLNSDLHEDMIIIIGLLEKSKFSNQKHLKFEGKNYLLFGINVEFDKDGWDSYQLKLLNLIRDHISYEARQYIRIEDLINYDNKDYCLIRIIFSEKAPRKWFYLDKNLFFVRNGNQTIQLNGQEMDDHKKLQPARN